MALYPLLVALALTGSAIEITSAEDTCASGQHLVLDACLQSAGTIVSSNFCGTNKHDNADACVDDSATTAIGFNGKDKSIVVQCCAMDSSVRGSAARPDCISGATFQDSAQRCADEGMRTCTEAEVRGAIGAGTGCNFRGKFV